MKNRESAGGIGPRISAAALAALMMISLCSCAGVAGGTGTGTSGQPSGPSEGPGGESSPPTGTGGTETGAETSPPEASVTGSEAASGRSVLDGKKVVFIGNSMIYYGGVVTKGGYRSSDTGWFYRICRANGDRTTVVDCTYGGHHLYDFAGRCRTSGCDVGVGGDLLKGLDLSSFDYVFMSESGDNNANFTADVRKVMARFPNPDTKFVYMCHTYSYDRGHTKVAGHLDELQKLGVIIADWGHVCYDLYSGKAKNPTATLKYVKNTFVNNVSGDSHHPNPLAGYIAALTCYCAVTGRSAVGQSYDDREKVKYGGGSVSYSDYTAKYYTSGNSNFTEVFASPADMAGIQGLIDEYVSRWAE